MPTSAYNHYIEQAVMTASPIELVRMIYRCALDSVAQARASLAQGDVEGRSKPVTKAFDAIAELVLSLDHEHGGDLSRRLAQLYDYMQRRLLEGHFSQTDAPFAEVESLLISMLEGWDQVRGNTSEEVPAAAAYGFDEAPQPIFLSA